MTGIDRIVFGFLLVDAVLLAIVELLFLPLYIDAVQFPVTALIAALTTPLLVDTAGRLSTRRLVALAPLAVWLLTVGVFGFNGPGGDMVAPGLDWRVVLLLVGGTLPAAMMLGIVRVRNENLAARG